MKGRLVAVVAVFGIVTTGCGTRVEPVASHEAVRGSQPLLSAPAAATGDGKPGSGVTDAGSAAVPASPASTRSSRPLAGSGSDRRAGAVGGVAVAATAGPFASPRPADEPGAASPPPVRSAPTGPAPGSSLSGAAAPKPATAGSPVILAFNGTISGPVGVIFVPLLEGAQLWVKHINSKGGLNGHEVRLNAYDDGADPARHRANAQRAIEQDHAIAFLANAESITGRCCIDYIESKRVPVIGNETGSQWFYESPMYFTQVSTGDPVLYGSLAGVAQQLVPAGKTKMAALTCVEGQICNDAQRVWSQAAKSLGLEIVYKAQTSLGQPDFTAECLAARNANANVLMIGMDSNSVRRVAASCARQGFRPAYATLSVAIAGSYAEDPNLDGLVGSTPGFPWFASGTPATDEFHAAFKIFGRNVPVSASVPIGWIAGKLLEKAGTKLPEPPTSAAILDGLWSIRDDTLGGITQPLTFHREEKTAEKSCWFNVTLKNGKWSSPDLAKLNCR